MDNNRNAGQSGPVENNGEETKEQTSLIRDFKDNLYTLFTAFVLVFSLSLVFGYNMGLLSHPSERGFLKDFINHTFENRNFSVTRETDVIDYWCFYVILMLVAGGFVGSLSFGLLSPALGRKWTLAVAYVLLLMGISFSNNSIQAKSYEQILLGRFLIGLYCGIGNTIGPMFLCEIAPVKYIQFRGFMGSCHQLFITIGFLLATIIGHPGVYGFKRFDGNWTDPVVLQIVPATLLFLYLPFIKNSWRYYFFDMKDEDMAKKALEWYKRSLSKEEIDDEISGMETEKKYIKGHVPITKLLPAIFNHYKMRMITGLMVIQQLTGINYILLSPETVFDMEIGLLNPIILIALVNVFGTILSMVFQLETERKTLMAISLTAMLILCVIVLITGGTGHSLFSLICGLCYVLSYSFGIGPVPWTLASEWFEQHERSSGMAVTCIVNWVTTLGFLYLFKLFQDVYKWKIMFFLMPALGISIFCVLNYIPKGIKDARLSDMAHIGPKHRLKDPQIEPMNN